MNERLLQFLAAENISQAQFADSINVARAGVSHIVAGRNKPSWDFILSTMKRYPTLNIEWLISGKGKMYKGPANAVNGGNGSFSDEYRTVNEGNGVKMEQDGLFGGNGLFDGGAEDRKDGEMFDAELVELGNSASQPAVRYNDSPTSQPVSRSVNQPAAVYVTTQNTLQAAVKKPNVIKVVVFFDDGTFQECK